MRKRIKAPGFQAQLSSQLTASPNLPALGVGQLESRSSVGQVVPANATWNKDEVSQSNLDLIAKL